MKEGKIKIADYLSELKSEASTPGGGAVSALTLAQGIALVMMVANLTIGKEKYKTFEKINREVLDYGEVLVGRAMELVDEDIKAFNIVSDAYKLPKESDEEKAIRSKKIREASVFATEVPLEVMKVAFEGLRLTTNLMGKSNINVISDLGAAATNLEAAIKASWLNVVINLPSIKNPEKEAEFREKGENYLKEGEAISRKIYEQVFETLES